MFDDPNPPSNLPTDGQEPEDIFKDVEPAPAAKPLSPAPAAPPPGPALPARVPLGEAKPEAIAPSVAETKAEVQVKEPVISSHKTIKVLGAIVGIAVVGGVAFAVFRFVQKTAEPAPTLPAPQEAPFPEEPDLPTIPSLPEPLPRSPGEPAELPGGSIAEPAAEPEPEPEAEPALTDADFDGLNDEEEASRGTQPGNPDSDNDGLFDGEEVSTYRTDPLDPDTDGDGFLDGQEVRNNYNPNGSGKLFNVPSQ